jgi:hypothetical protein
MHTTAPSSLCDDPYPICCASSGVPLRYLLTTRARVPLECLYLLSCPELTSSWKSIFGEENPYALGPRQRSDLLPEGHAGEHNMYRGWIDMQWGPHRWCSSLYKGSALCVWGKEACTPSKPQTSGPRKPVKIFSRSDSSSPRGANKSSRLWGDARATTSIVPTNRIIWNLC